MMTRYTECLYYESYAWKNLFFLCVLNFRIHTYEHERSWGKALGAYDIMMASPETTPDVGILQVSILVRIQQSPWELTIS